MESFTKILLVLGVALSLPVAADTNSYVKTGRYTEVKTGPNVGQIDPLSDIVNLNLSTRIKSTEQALQFLLKGSGYELQNNNYANRDHKKLMELPLADVHRSLGPITLFEALDLVTGKPYYPVVDDVNRKVAFKLKAEYADAANAAFETEQSVYTEIFAGLNADAQEPVVALSKPKLVEVKPVSAEKAVAKAVESKSNAVAMTKELNVEPKVRVNNYSIQVLASKKMKAAELESKRYERSKVIKEKGVYKVIVPGFETKREAMSVAKTLGNGWVRKSISIVEDFVKPAKAITVTNKAPKNFEVVANVAATNSVEAQVAEDSTKPINTPFKQNKRLSDYLAHNIKSFSKVVWNVKREKAPLDYEINLGDAWDNRTDEELLTMVKGNFPVSFCQLADNTLLIIHNSSQCERWKNI